MNIQEAYLSLLAHASPDFQKALQEEADYQARVIAVQALLPGAYTYEQVATACAASGIKTSAVAFCLASGYNCEGIQRFYEALGQQ